MLLEFTPLEFETISVDTKLTTSAALEFTPLEFETLIACVFIFMAISIRIYSVGVWNEPKHEPAQSTKQLEFTPLEFETIMI